MQITNKILKIKLNNTPTVELIENKLRQLDGEPIRWAIVKSENGEVTVNATLQV